MGIVSHTKRTAGKIEEVCPVMGDGTVKERRIN
jgi:hypothetical protein